MSVTTKSNVISEELLEPIDIVYLWCDGNDPEFVKRKNKYLSKKENTIKASGDVRFFDNEELKYSLRSLEMYAPWINHVYIITDRQIPKWLNIDYEKVTIVDHSEIMPPECISCFNSNVIEYFLPYVPNLNEKFLYGNDDTFFGRSVEPCDFFDGEKPIVRLTKASTLKCFKKFVRKLLGGSSLKNITPIDNAVNLLSKDYGEILQVSSHHNIDAYSRSSYLRTLRKYDDAFSVTNKYRFRDKHCIHRLIFAIDAILSDKAFYEIVPTFDGLSKIFVSLQRKENFSANCNNKLNIYN